MRSASTIYGCSSVGRALVSKTRCREFESLLPCKYYKNYEYKKIFSGIVYRTSAQGDLANMERTSEQRCFSYGGFIDICSFSCWHGFHLQQIYAVHLQFVILNRRRFQ